MAIEDKKREQLVKEYLDLKSQCEKCKLPEGNGWKIEIAYKPILPGHIIVKALNQEGKQIQGSLIDQIENKDKQKDLRKAFEGVIEGIRLLKEKIKPKPERIYLGCFSDSGKLHFHLYPVLPKQKPYNGHALDWLSSFERRASKIPECICHISESDLRKLIQHVQWAIDKLTR